MLSQNTIVSELLFVMFILILESDEESKNLDIYDILEAFLITIKFVILYLNLIEAIGFVYGSFVTIGIISLVAIISISWPFQVKLLAEKISKKRHQILRTIILGMLIYYNH